MPVPKMKQLRPGVDVNVVLKADQRSGKLTNGSISEILTRGDHPRGVKVRLHNGQIGRVQSLSMASNASVDASSTGLSPDIYTSERGPSQSYTRRGGLSGQRGRHAQQDEESSPLESCSLADYIKSPSSQRPAPASGFKDEEAVLQTQMESEFPKLDSALIAAILTDYPDSAEAKNVLSALL